MEKIIKRDYFAIRILQKLMDRRNEPGYEEKAAIYEAYKLADLMVNLSGIPTYENHKLNETKECLCPGGVGACGFGDPDINLCNHPRR